MKALVCTLAVLAMTAAASPAMAYVVMVTTSVPAASLTDDAQLKTAVASAIEDVLAHAIRFTPTVVTLEAVRVVGDRVYLLMTIADADGEASLDGMATDGMATDEPMSTEPARKVAPSATY
jgi:hypothetical protein